MINKRIIEPQLKKRKVRKAVVKKKIQDIKTNNIITKYLPEKRTEYTRTFQLNDGKYIVAPSIYGNKMATIPTIKKIITENNFIDPETNRKLPRYKTRREANKAAQRRSQQIVRNKNE
jgi:hypothetical protein